jgi:hypothetical protein
MTQNGTAITGNSTACGGTTPDLCSPFFSQSYSQALPDSIWDLTTIPTSPINITLPNSPDPGERFLGPTEATVLGMQLADAMGPFPASYTDAAITWQDQDRDGHPGLSSLMRNTGTSTACNLPYANLPIPSDFARATTVFVGSRALANLDGTIVDCNTITGNYAGPLNGLPQLEGHVDGCVKSDNSLCTTAETDSLDQSAAGAAIVTHAVFSMVRVADNVTCSQVRAMRFP